MQLQMRLERERAIAAAATNNLLQSSMGAQNAFTTGLSGFQSSFPSFASYTGFENASTDYGSSYPTALDNASHAEAELLRLQRRALAQDPSLLRSSHQQSSNDHSMSKPLSTRFGGQNSLLSIYISTQRRRDSALQLALGEDEFAFSVVYRNRDKAGLEGRRDPRDTLPDYTSGVRDEQSFWFFWFLGFF